MLLLGHQGQNGLGVLVGLLLAGRARVLAVVGELPAAAQVTDGVRVDDGGAAARHHGPNAPARIQNGELERGARLGVQLSDVGLLGVGVAAERRWELQLAVPLDAAQVVRRLIDLARQVQDEHGAVGHHQRVDLQIGEVQVHVDLEEVGDEVGQHPVHNRNNKIWFIIYICFFLLFFSFNKQQIYFKVLYLSRIILCMIPDYLESLGTVEPGAKVILAVNELRLDRGLVDRPNLLCEVIERYESYYKLAGEAGVLEGYFQRNTFQLKTKEVEFNVNREEKDIPVRTAVTILSLGHGQGVVKCNCTQSWMKQRPG